jgi:hypothetical protein
MTRSRDVADVQENLGGAVPPIVAGKNAIINGGMDIWQRGTSFTIGAGAYTADRWKCSTGGPTLTITRQTTSDTTNLPNIQYAARVQRNSGQTSTTAFNFANSFESVNSIPFAGKVVTFSFYARKGANYSATSNALTVNLYSGTGTDQSWIDVAYTGQTTVAGGTATLTTTWQRFTFTGTVASTATELAIVYQASGTGTAGANDWYEVTGVQVEAGSVATPFSRAGATIQGELAVCQRYFYNMNQDFFLVGQAKSSTLARGLGFLPVTMRVQPTLTLGSWRIYYATSDTDASTSAVTLTAAKDSIWIEQTTSSVLTAGQSVFFSNYSSTTNTVNAEL